MRPGRGVIHGSSSCMGHSISPFLPKLPSPRKSGHEPYSFLGRFCRGHSKKCKQFIQYSARVKVFTRCNWRALSKRCHVKYLANKMSRTSSQKNRQARVLHSASPRCLAGRVELGFVAKKKGGGNILFLERNPSLTLYRE